MDRTDTLMAADPQLFAAAFSKAEARHGAIETFLVAGLGLATSSRARLADALLVPSHHVTSGHGSRP